MPPTAAQHPSDAELAAFALGKLDPAATEAVSRHIAECSACRAVAEQTPTDSLVHLLRGANAARGASPHAATPSLQGSATYGPLPPPAPALDPADLPPALRDHPRYRMLRQLGQGGMGVVYQAEHKVMKRLVAVKVVNRAMVDNPEAMQRFDREIQTAAQLDHPNIVKAFDAERAGELQLLAMEYVEGKSLADVLDKKGPLPVAHACHYARQAALGLQYAHERGMVHRDIKPQNLMLTPKGVVKILDFGLAKLASERTRQKGLTHENTVMGTPEYLAPEQAQNTKAADIRADIYALGCTLYCLLTGRPPFTGEDWLAVLMAHLHEAPPMLEGLRPEVPPALAALVARMLAKDPAQRPQTPKEVAEALAPFAKSAAKAAKAAAATEAVPLATLVDDGEPFAGLPAPRAETARPAPRPADRRRWLIPAGLALSVLLAGAVVAGIVLLVRTKAGVVRLVVDPPDAEVLAGEGRIAVARNGDAEPYTVRVAAGGGKLIIRKAGFKIETREVALDDSGKTLTVQLEPDVANALAPVGDPAGNRPAPPATGMAQTTERPRPTESAQPPERPQPLDGRAPVPIEPKPTVPPPATGPARAVRDEDNIFSADAKQEANRIIADIEQRFRGDVTVEAYFKVPAGKADEFEKRWSDEAFRRSFFKQWLHERARETQTHGVFVLLYAGRGHSYVLVERGDRTRRREFTDADAAEMSRILRQHFTKTELDQGLVEALEFARTVFASHAKAGPAPPVHPREAAPTVQDEGNLFSADIKEEANRIIADIEKRTKKQVRVEAYNQPPADKAQEFNQKKTNREFRQRFFTEWAERQFEATVTIDILVLIYRESGRGYFTRAVADADTIHREFPRNDLTELERIIDAQLAKSAPNLALLDGLKFVRERLEHPQLTTRLQPAKGAQPLDCTGLRGVSAADVRAAQEAWAKQLRRKVEEEDEIAPGVRMTFVLVPPGKFKMGSPPGEAFQSKGEALHVVTLTRPFYLGKYEVTQAQYEAVTGRNPSHFRGASLPVETVSWEDADIFARKLSQKSTLRHLYRLPSEAEWEYACRGGHPSSDPFGNVTAIGRGWSLSHREANFNRTAGQTWRVGGYAANALGLFDMHGNVSEWCADWYERDYQNGAPTDPVGPLEGSLRVFRGGSWNSASDYCRAAYRNGYDSGYRSNELGFRLVRIPSGLGK
jgi:formylglycine-generating enzyme required for sulfatase activity